MDTRSTQWHKQNGGEEKWHVWAVGDEPGSDAPLCGTLSVEATGEVFGGQVTLDDMCEGCRTYHMNSAG